MDDSRSKKQQEMCRLGSNSDFISNLPENVTDEILVRLPIGDAVRTCVLSTKWRYKWTTITQLVFHDHNLGLPPSPPPPSHNNNSNDKLINFIYRVLLLHSGFIHKFELSIKWLPRISSTIDFLILFLSRKNTKELVLKFSRHGVERYKLPICFFSVQQISTLELHCCVLKKPPPTTFTGFSNLKSLCLEETTFVDKGGFECLISKCPLLERLTLDMIGGINHHNISSPNLKYFRLHGCFEDICFENTPLLSDVSIHNFMSNKKLKNQSETGNVVKVLSSLPNLRRFDAGLDLLKFLIMGKIPKKLPFTCHHLNNLSLRLNFEYVNHICVTLCLLNSSPSLRELEIEVYPSYNSGQDIENFWEKRTLIDWNMSGLQIVKITNVEGFKLELELELEFIKLLLANSPMLEMLSIRYGGPYSKRNVLGREGLEFLKELLIFPRASNYSYSHVPPPKQGSSSLNGMGNEDAKE